MLDKGNGIRVPRPGIRIRTGHQLVVNPRNGYNVDDVCKQVPAVRGVAPTLDDLDATENFIGSKGWHFVRALFRGHRNLHSPLRTPPLSYRAGPINPDYMKRLNAGKTRKD